MSSSDIDYEHLQRALGAEQPLPKALNPLHRDAYRLALQYAPVFGLQPVEMSRTSRHLIFARHFAPDLELSLATPARYGTAAHITLNYEDNAPIIPNGDLPTPEQMEGFIAHYAKISAQLREKGYNIPATMGMQDDPYVELEVPMRFKLDLEVILTDFAELK